MTVAYPLTASESQTDIDNVCVDETWEYYPETHTHYGVITKDDGSLPSFIVITNSGTVDGEELIGGVHSVSRPK